MFGHITVLPLRTFLEIKFTWWLFCHFCALFCGRFVWLVIVNASLRLQISRQWLFTWTDRTENIVSFSLGVPVCAKGLILRDPILGIFQNLSPLYVQLRHPWYLYAFGNEKMVGLLFVWGFLFVWVDFLGFLSPVSVTDNLKFYPQWWQPPVLTLHVTSSSCSSSTFCCCFREAEPTHCCW